MFFSPPAPPPPKKQRTGLLGSARDPLPRHLLLETLRRVKMRSNPQKCSYVLNVYNSLRCSMSSFTHVYVRLNTPNPRVLGATMSPRGHHGVPHRSLRDSTRSLRVRRARGAVYSCRLPPCVQGSARARADYSLPVAFRLLSVTHTKTHAGRRLQASAEATREDRMQRRNLEARLRVQIPSGQVGCNGVLMI